MQRRNALVWMGAVLLWLAAPRVSHAADIAVVVHPEVRVDDLSFPELRKILLGDRQFWSSGQPVALIVRAPVSEERTVLLDMVYEMSEAQFRKYWIAKVFRAEATSGPTVVVSNADSVELVRVIPGAIALMDAADVPSGHKILTVDGHAPGDPEYKLRASGPAGEKG